jgi:hypothetical protein
MSKNKQKSVRIQLPKGDMYQVLAASAKLHGTESLSRYILNAAMTYTIEYVKRKNDELEKSNTGGSIRNTSEPESGTGDST